MPYLYKNSMGEDNNRCGHTIEREDPRDTAKKLIESAMAGQYSAQTEGEKALDGKVKSLQLPPGGASVVRKLGMENTPGNNVWPDFPPVQRDALDKLTYLLSSEDLEQFMPGANDVFRRITEQDGAFRKASFISVILEELLRALNTGGTATGRGPKKYSGKVKEWGKTKQDEPEVGGLEATAGKFVARLKGWLSSIGGASSQVSAARQVPHRDAFTRALETKRRELVPLATYEYLANTSNLQELASRFCDLDGAGCLDRNFSDIFQNRFEQESRRRGGELFASFNLVMSRGYGNVTGSFRDLAAGTVSMRPDVENAVFDLARTILIELNAEREVKNRAPGMSWHQSV